MLAALSGAAPASAAVTAQRARASFERAFPRIAQGPRSSTLHLRHGEKVLQYRGSRGALISDANGHRFLVDSFAPLRSSVGDGTRQPVDLGLRAKGRAFGSINPLVPVLYGDTAATAVELRSSGVGIAPATGGHVQARLDGNTVYYANVNRDTDFAVQPIADGAETMYVLRSDASPQTLHMRFRLPRAARLVSDSAAGTTAAVVAGGRQVALIGSVQVNDAAGREVPATTRVVGDGLTIRIPHRDRTVTYPLLVDPGIHDATIGPIDSTIASSGWSFSYNPNPWWNSSAGQLYIGHRGDFAYGPGAWGAWTYVANRANPSSTAYVFRFETMSEHAYDNGSTEMQQGIQRGTGGWEPYAVWTSNTGGSGQDPSHTGYIGQHWQWHCVIATCNAPDYRYAPNGDTRYYSKDRAVVAMVFTHPENLGTRTDWLRVYTANVYLDDPEPPSTSGAPGSPSGWTNGGPFTAKLSASDPGLGVYSTTLFNGTVPVAEQRAPIRGQAGAAACTGESTAPCPSAWTNPGFSYAGPNQAQGHTRFQMQARDVSGHKSTAYGWDLWLDRDAPSVTLGGSLYDHRVNGGAADETLSGGTYDLTVSAKDGAVSPATDQDLRSGVDTIKVELHNDTGDDTDNRCASTQAADWTTLRDYGHNPNTANNAGWTPAAYSLDPSQYGPGRRVIRVTATDRAGNVSRTCFNVEITSPVKVGDRPDYSFDMYRLSDRASMGVNLANGNLLLSSQDLKIAGTQLDLSLQRFYNSRDRTAGELGVGGRFSIGQDLALYACTVDGTQDSRCLVGPTGYRARFELQSDGSYKTPDDVNATLTKVDDGFKLVDDRSGLTMHFVSGTWSYLNWMKDRDVADHDANKITFDYDNRGLHQITDNHGRHVAVTLNANTDITTITDSQNRVWKYDYYPGTRQLWKVTNPAGEVFEYHYDADDHLDWLKDPRGSQYSFGYDDQNRIKTVTRPVDDDPNDNVTTTYTYGDPTDPCVSDPSGDDEPHVGKTTVTDPRGHDTIYCWTDSGRVTKVKDALGNKRDRKYTPNGDLQDYTQTPGTGQPGTFSWSYSSDGTNNLSGGSSPDGATFSVGYCGQTGEPACSTYPQAHFQPTSVAGPNKGSRSMTYNGDGDMTTVTGGSGAAQSQITLDHFADGRLKTATDGRGNVTTYGYDDNGDLNSIDPPGGAIANTTFGHDALSRISWVRDGRHQADTDSRQIESIDYDGVDRPTKVIYGDGSWFDTGYDADGNVVSRTEGTGNPDGTNEATTNTTTYGYDRRNLRTSEDQLGPAFTSYTYDGAGNMDSVTDPGGTTTYGFDEINRPVTVAVGGQPAITLSYQDSQRTSTISFPGGVDEVTATNKSGATTSITVRDPSGSTMRELDYDYEDGCGSGSTERTQVERLTLQSGRYTCFDYDTLDRLTDATTYNSSDTQIESYHYDYDAASNRTQRTHTDGDGTHVTSYAYNEPNELCWSASGSATSDCASAPSGATNYAYDDSGNLTDDGQHTYSYDIRNRLTGIDASNLSYLSPTNDELVGYGSSSVENNLLGVSAYGSERYVRTPDGSLLAQHDATSTQYVLHDRLGTTTGLLEGSSIVRDYTYDPDGQDTSTDDTGPSIALRYAGGLRLDGLDHFGARYYDAGTARWTQQDPLDGSSELTRNSRYSYVAEDPLNQTDPGGLMPIEHGCWDAEYYANADGITCYTPPLIEWGCDEMENYCGSPFDRLYLPSGESGTGGGLH